MKGHDVLFVPGERDGVVGGAGVIEHWKAVVEDRFLIHASRRDVLEQALTRPGGTVAGLVKATGFAGPVKDQDRELEVMTVFRQWENRVQPWFSTKTSVRMRLDIDKTQIELRASASHPEEFVKGMQKLWTSSGGSLGSFQRLSPRMDGVIRLVFTFPTNKDGRMVTFSHSVPWLVGFVFYI